ncbi:PTS transporter subunit IIC [Ignatzschineria indica]|uniref:PTS transporter subunit IIC n=1 Tax=Ignatzschineria indica TaxID=472583 RepID=UPI0025773F4B|nr:PTS sugar transporter subunit IIC [Ignatzschineria indica]
MARGVRGFLAEKGVTLSPKIYFIDALSYMALGLFSSLLMGLIVKTLGQQLGWESFVELGSFAMKPEIVGGAIGVAIAASLKAPPLILFSAVFVGAFGNNIGGPAGAYVAVLIAVELTKLIYKSTKLDIIIVPFIAFLVGFWIAKWIGIPIHDLMRGLGDLINWATEQRPLVMSILVATVMGLALTAPISSAALSFMLGLDGFAAGAAVIGCSAQMIGFATSSYRDNGFGGLIAQGVGTSMLQIANIIRKPLILIPPTVAGMIAAPIGVVLFKMTNNAAGAGMGTSGFVGQFMAFESMGFSMTTAIYVLICHFILPAVISLLLAYWFYQKGWLKLGDMKLNYE